MITYLDLNKIVLILLMMFSLISTVMVAVVVFQEIARFHISKAAIDKQAYPYLDEDWKFIPFPTRKLFRSSRIGTLKIIYEYDSNKRLPGIIQEVQIKGKTIKVCELTFPLNRQLPIEIKIRGYYRALFKEG